MKTTTQKFVALSFLSLTLVACGGKDHSKSAQGASPNITTLAPETCPSGYAKVSDFCVMKYEAKKVGGVATSQADLTPWTGTYHSEALAACQSLGSGYDLISNEEWLRVAREVEQVDANWTGGSVGSGCLFRGNNGQPFPWNPCGYGSGDGSIHFGDNRDPRAQFTLASGEIIFDLAGNVSEWVKFENVPTTCAQVSTELVDIADDLDCTLLPEQYEAHDTTLTSAQGIGKFLGGQGGLARRGGASYSGESAGIYALALERGGSNADGDNGFRCVYRPSI